MLSKIAAKIKMNIYDCKKWISADASFCGKTLCFHSTGEVIFA